MYCVAGDLGHLVKGYLAVWCAYKLFHYIELGFFLFVMLSCYVVDCISETEFGLRSQNVFFSSRAQNTSDTRTTDYQKGNLLKF